MALRMCDRDSILMNMYLNRYQAMNGACSMVMEDDLDESYALAIGLKEQRHHAFWMSPFLKDRRDMRQRNTLAELEMDFIRLGCHSDFHKTTRMSPEVYQELLEKVRPRITYKDTNFRDAITAEERLSITIRYLTRGDSVTSLWQGYLVGESTVLPLVRDTCRALYSVLYKEYLSTPCTEEQWLDVAKGFHDRWNMPNCLGALDGKHVRITRPHKSGTTYYNYKNFYSIVLFAAVDSDYKFMYADVGAEGRASDSTLWKYSQFNRCIEDENNPLHVPAPCDFPGYKGKMPYFFVGDDAFELSDHLMKPYPSTRLSMMQRIFNYRLSRARRIVENAFGILATRFRILRREIEMTPDHATEIVLACIVLHNFLWVKAPHAYMPRPATDWEDRDYHQHQGLWRGERALPSMLPTMVRNRSETVKDVRDKLAAWCMTKEGELPFQYQVVLEHDFYFGR